MEHCALTDRSSVDFVGAPKFNVKPITLDASICYMSYEVPLVCVSHPRITLVPTHFRSDALRDTWIVDANTRLNGQREHDGLEMASVGFLSDDSKMMTVSQRPYLPHTACRRQCSRERKIAVRLGRKLVG